MPDYSKVSRDTRLLPDVGLICDAPRRMSGVQRFLGSARRSSAQRCHSTTRRLPGASGTRGRSRESALTCDGSTVHNRRASNPGDHATLCSPRCHINMWQLPGATATQGYSWASVQRVSAQGVDVHATIFGACISLRPNLSTPNKTICLPPTQHSRVASVRPSN